MGKAVHAKLLFKPRVIGQDKDCILRHRLSLAVPVALNSPHPVEILGVVNQAVLHGVNRRFSQFYPCSLIPRRKFLHGLKGRALPYRRIFLASVIQRAELMYTYQVKGVAVHAGGRICRMVGISELPVIGHKSSGCGTLAVGIPPFHTVYRRIYIREKRLYGVLYGVRPAEGSDNPFLSRRVLLFLSAMDKSDFAACHRPCAGILPVVIPCQYLIGIKECPLPGIHGILPVPRAARPVHQPAGFEGRRVEVIHAYIFGNSSRHRLIGLRLYPLG